MCGTFILKYKKMRTQTLLIVLFCSLLLSCSDNKNNDGSADTNLKEEIQRVLNNVRATKTINSYDELGCEIYRTSTTNPDASAPTNATIDYELGDDQKEGVGSFKLKYDFTGKSLTAGPEIVYFEQTWGDYRVDLSFYPLGLSLWVKGKAGNKGVFRFIIMEDE